jgi:NAD(P)-dependent dehydrogenase (short-subunit alcohol dehydrogenase family)
VSAIVTGAARGLGASVAVPLRRLGAPAEVARAIAFLLVG